MNAPASLSAPDVRIRPAVEADAADLAGLVAELGYPTEVPVVRQRLTELLAAGDQALVAEHAGRAVGLVLLHRMHLLHRAPDGRIATLVVADGFRSQGLGERLLRAAEQELQQQGCGRVEVSSGAQREAAHRFYRRAGYEEQPKRFIKPVNG